MSANSAQEHAGSGARLYAWVWMWLLALTGIEVYLGYVNFGTNLMLTLLLGLSVIKAVLIIAYFMHLRFERLSVFLTLWPIMVLCIALILIFAFPDSFRIHDLGLK